MKSHKDLDVWKMAMQLAADVYHLVELFPKYERYGLSSQMCRAAVSIPSNIAEGAARQNKKELIQFLYFSLGSSAELETQLELSKTIGYVAESDVKRVMEKQVCVSKMILGLIRSLKNG